MSQSFIMTCPICGEHIRSLSDWQGHLLCRSESARVINTTVSSTGDLKPGDVFELPRDQIEKLFPATIEPVEGT